MHSGTLQANANAWASRAGGAAGGTLQGHHTLDAWGAFWLPRPLPMLLDCTKRQRPCAVYSDCLASAAGTWGPPQRHLRPCSPRGSGWAHATHGQPGYAGGRAASADGGLSFGRRPLRGAAIPKGTCIADDTETGTLEIPYSPFPWPVCGMQYYPPTVHYSPISGWPYYSYTGTALGGHCPGGYAGHHLPGRGLLALGAAPQALAICVLSRV